MAEQLTLDDLRNGLSKQARARLAKGLPLRKPLVVRGYGGSPGAGPTGETCKSCRHKQGFGGSRTYYKCALFMHQTGSPTTDIRLKSPACEKWEGKES